MKQNKIGKDFAVFGIWGDSTAAVLDLYACVLWVVCSINFKIFNKSSTKHQKPDPETVKPRARSF